MRVFPFLWTAFAACTVAQVTLTGTNTESGTSTIGDLPTAGTLTYKTETSIRTLSAAGSSETLSASGSMLTASNTTANATAAANGTLTTTADGSETTLLGGTRTSAILNGTATGNSTASGTSSIVQPTNTQPCNGYPEFCSRKYSNITHIGAHNSPFVRPGNVASNQALEVESQLNDGIRMLQFQVHQPNGTGTPLYLCHSTCELLNAGLLTDYLSIVTNWLEVNRYDIITILMGNSDVIGPGNFTAAVQEAGLDRFAYTPATVPMTIDQWPTLSEMILTNQRAVIMLDYEANQDAYPWLLDEFSYMWETPFSPTDPAFPCTVQRPPDQADEITRSRMYMANHNLNVDIAFAGFSILVPDYNRLNVTNAADVDLAGSAARQCQNCTEMWDRPPNFLLVDFYNIGNYNGSVFEVAATANNVTYDQTSCCDTEGAPLNAGTVTSYSPLLAFIAGMAALVMTL